MLEECREERKDMQREIADEEEVRTRPNSSPSDPHRTWSGLPFRPLSRPSLRLQSDCNPIAIPGRRFCGILFYSVELRFLK
jgi:hypothetical protein